MILKKFFRYLFILVFFVYPNKSNANSNISYIDIDYIMNNSIAGKSIIEQLKKGNQTILESLKKDENSLKNEEVKIKAQKNILDKAVYDKNIISFKEKIINYNKLKNKKLSLLNNKKKKALNELTQKLTVILATYSKENSISIIMPRKSIIIGETKLDITKDIMKILNQSISKIVIK